MTHVLIVNIEPQFRNTLSDALKRHRHRVTLLDNGSALAAAVTIHQPDAVILDIDFEPLEACRDLHTWSSIPVIAISDDPSEARAVEALDGGADDFLVKPFGAHELLARIRAIYRRIAIARYAFHPTISVGKLSVNPLLRRVTLNDQQIHLTRKEYRLLEVLLHAKGQLVTYEKIAREIWGEKRLIERASVRTLVKQLRRKLQDDPQQPSYLLTEAGIGYRLNLPVPDV